MSHAPRVFVGSALEHLELLKRLNVQNAHSRVRYLPWTNLGSFSYNEYTLLSLAKRLRDMDGAAFLFWGTDKTWWRGQTHDAPRDNVVLEAGIAIGTLGLSRTAFVTDATTRLPSDFAGLNPVTVTLSGDHDMDASILHDSLERFFATLSFTKHLARNIWTADSYRIFFHSFDNPEPGEFEEIVNFNAVRAIGTLTDYFSRAGIASTLHSARSQHLDIDDNIVLLGSSASNRVTGRLVAAAGGTLPFECEFDIATRQNRRVTSSVTGRSYSSRFENGDIVLDYAVLTRIPNPFRRHADVVIAAGNYGLGTLAAITCSVSPEILGSAAHDYRGAFQAIIEVPVLGYHMLGVPRIVEFSAIAGSLT